MVVVLSCEHGGNRLPRRYRGMIDSSLLASHRGYDPGALALGRELAEALGAPLFYSTTSRLLVELNRSLGHPQLFSPPVQALPNAEREELLARFYRPYRDGLERRIAGHARRGQRVLHVSCHSFTPVLDGRERRADVALLFDPGRELEAGFCAGWQRRMREAEPGFRVRRNYPYRGTSDCFTASLRKRLDPARYLGITVEVNQKYPLGAPRHWRALRRYLIATLAAQLLMGEHRAPTHFSRDLRLSPRPAGSVVPGSGGLRSLSFGT